MGVAGGDEQEGRVGLRWGIKAVPKNKTKQKNFAFARVELDVRGVEEETGSQGGLSRREHYRVICGFSSDCVE